MYGDDFKPEVEFDINPGDVVPLTGGDYRLPGPNGSVYILNAATGSLTYHGPQPAVPAVPTDSEQSS